MPEDTELSFLLSCIDSSDAGALPPDNIDWSRLRILARRHRLIPHVYLRLKALPPGNVPPGILAEYEQKMLANTARNSFLNKELNSAVNLLEKEEIRTIPFKGPALAVEAYGDLSLRQFDDLDLLIKKSDIIRASKLLADRGYEPMIRLSGHLREKHVAAGWGISLKSPALDYHLELITNVLPDLYSFSLPEDIFSSEVEANLLLLCVHGSKHQWERLSWIADIAFLLRRHDSLDWDLLISRAKNSGSLRMLLLGLALADTLNVPDYPESVTTLIGSDPYIAAMTSAIVRSHSLHEDPEVGIMDEISFMLKVRERTIDRIRYILCMIFRPSSSDWQAVDLPESLYFAYYFIRPFRLLFKRTEC